MIINWSSIFYCQNRGVELSYRFSFNGMEKDDEVKGVGNSYTTEFRMNDPRVGRWFSIDPITHSWMSPYTSMDNNPILFIDPFGDEITYQNRKEYREFRRARKKDGTWADIKHKYKGNTEKNLKILETSEVDNTMASGKPQEETIKGTNIGDNQDYYYYNSKGNNNGESGAAGSRETINPIQSRSIEALRSTFSQQSPISGQVLALSPPRSPQITVNEPFIPNLPTFVNPVNANRQIRNAANVYLNNLGATQIFITIGTIQTNLNLPMGNGTNLRQLLQQRANIVRNQLIQMGVPAVAFPNDWLRFAPGTSIGTTIRVR